jgi:hypothetical protein
MFWAITGGILGGGIALAALYDFITKRHGQRNSISAAGPTNNTGATINALHDEFNHP